MLEEQSSKEGKLKKHAGYVVIQNASTSFHYVFRVQELRWVAPFISAKCKSNRIKFHKPNMITKNPLN